MGRFEWGSEPNTFADATVTDNQVIHAAVAANKIWIRSIAIQCAAANTAGIEDEDGTLLFPEMQTAFIVGLNIPVTENKGIQVVKSGGGVSALFVEYYIEPADHI